MKKFLLSAVLGLTLAALPASIYAACADVITYDLGTHIKHCFLISSAGNGSICYYVCHNVPKDGPGIEEPGNN